MTAVGLASCARPGAPPGGQVDRRPPVVVSVDPDTFALVEPGRRTLRVRFNERISEQPVRGTLGDAVTISPRSGPVRVEHGREGIEIELLGGFGPGRVYTVTVQPVLQDMFRNPMAVPFEWTFSTGGEFNRNAIVGAVWDRVTGDAVEGAEVRVLPVDVDGQPTDSLPWVAETDEEGVFALRYLPTGRLRVLAFQDRNGNGDPDLLEPQYQLPPTQMGPADTLTFANVPLVPGDTTPARLLRAEVLDSLTLRLAFDDVLDPAVPAEEFRTSLEVPEADSLQPQVPVSDVSVPEVVRTFHEHEFAEWLDSIAEAAPQPAADTVPVAALDTGQVTDTGVVADTGAVTDPMAQEAERPRLGQGLRPLADAGELLPDGRPVPQQSFVVRLGSPLPVGVPLQTTVAGVINIGQRAGGGGRAIIVRSAPPADTAGTGASDAAADTGGVAAAGTPPDTARFVPLPGAR